MGKLFPRIPVWGVIDLGRGRSSVGGRSAGRSAAENPQSGTGRRRRRRPNDSEFQQRIQELDSPCYETRRLAAERLEHWLGMPEMAAMLAEQFQQLIVQPELPFEVRWRILIWRTRLPLVKSEPPQSVSAEELQRLVRQLDDDSYSVRVGASERLQWMAGQRASGQTDPADPEASPGRSFALRGILSPRGIDPQHCLGRLAHQRCFRLGSAAGFRCANRRLAG